MNIRLCSPVTKSIGIRNASRSPRYASRPRASSARPARTITPMCSKNVMLLLPKKPGTARSIVSRLMFSKRKTSPYMK